MNVQVSRALETSQRQPCQEPWLQDRRESSRSVQLLLHHEYPVLGLIKGRAADRVFTGAIRWTTSSPGGRPRGARCPKNGPPVVTSSGRVRAG
jgi:hypothetical protein